MDLRVIGRTAIVTGGSKGIGRAIAKSLADEGVNVAICARDTESLMEAQMEIVSSGGNSIAIPADVTRPESVRKVVEATIERFGALDILVNNAGGATKFGGFCELNHQDWLDAFELNVGSAVCFIRESLPWLRKSEAARIINICSISGVQPGSYNPHYAASKAALINLSKHIANQFAPENILVNAVCPGPVHSSSWDKNIERIGHIRGIPFDQARAQVESEEAGKIPLGWVGNGDDVAGLVTFLASDKAAWITGSCFHVNGGKLRSMS